MTLQVAMLACDGWILASDTLEVQGHPIELRTTSHTSKITYDGRVAYASCGDEAPRLAAKDVAQAYESGAIDFTTPETAGDEIRAIGAKRWK